MRVHVRVHIATNAHLPVASWSCAWFMDVAIIVHMCAHGNANGRAHARVASWCMSSRMPCCVVLRAHVLHCAVRHIRQPLSNFQLRHHISKCNAELHRGGRRPYKVS